MVHRSLRLRLVLASALWIVLILAAAGVLLTLLFRGHIERRFDAQLYDHMEELIAASEPAGDALDLTWQPSDPRFSLPGSGWYWEIRRDGRTAAHSDSLRYGELIVAAPVPSGVAAGDGPLGEALRLRWQDVTLPDLDGQFRYIVAGPAADVAADVRAFGAKLALTLAALGLGAVATVLLQIRYGLQPLDLLRRGVAAVRAGRTQRLADDVPAEVKPLVTEINDLLDHSAGLIARARGSAADLAHALKTPLSVIRNEAAEIGGPQGAVLREQVAALDAYVERYLSRARSAGGATAVGARTSVFGAIEDLRFSLKRLYSDRDLAFEVAGIAGLVFRGDPQDLEEMLGNLMDNACKWARSRVRVTAGRDGERLRLTVEDDGPGIPPPARDAALARGGRLDEAVAGSGLGLAIVRDLLELYRGGLRLEASELGGLKAVLDLPAAETASETG
jgi:signal transduction histidine kinase